VRLAIEQAHAAGLRVLLVPHLWVERGGWRGEIEPGDDAAWAVWAKGYTEFVLAWAEVARDARVDLFAVGIELRSWVTTSRAPSFIDVVRQAGLRVPMDVSVVGFDDIEQASYPHVALTTVRQDPARLGTAAVRWVNSRLNDLAPNGDTSVIIEPELVIRHSTASRS